MAQCHHHYCLRGLVDTLTDRCCHCGAEASLTNRYDPCEPVYAWGEDMHPGGRKHRKEVSFDLSPRTRMRVWYASHMGDDGPYGVGTFHPSKTIESLEFLLDVYDTNTSRLYRAYLRLITGPTDDAEQQFLRVRTPLELRWNNWEHPDLHGRYEGDPPVEGFD